MQFVVSLAVLTMLGCCEIATYMTKLKEEPYFKNPVLTPRGLSGWGFFDSIGDMTLLIRPPNFFNMAENNKTNIFRKRRFCTFIWCNELIHVSYRKNMKNPER